MTYFTYIPTYIPTFKFLQFTLDYRRAGKQFGKREAFSVTIYNTRKESKAEA